MVLTAEEKLSFTLAQITQLNRMVDQERLLPVPIQGVVESKGDYDARVIVERDVNVSKLANIPGTTTTPAGGLRARINIDGFTSSINYNADDDDYTAAEKNALLWGHKPNAGTGIIATAQSILDLDVDMVSRGINDDLREFILKARGG